MLSITKALRMIVMRMKILILHVRGYLTKYFRGEQWPLFELCVTLVNKNEAIVHASFDALVLDASSMKILAKDLNQLLKDIHTNLPPLDITFRDYVLALEDQRETAILFGCKGILAR